ncbi:MULTISPECIES: hypothetical protein [Methylorubrum]|uniref:hypothetical protein n=1 Tax=Methylorubrum TaxID=2282523 RepID=UPI00209D8969|nr:MULTISPECIES: hypothetical protein [Methylorubrum]MCP1550664.1 hypothetical protein [Methylorubrum zatmanii]MCP1552723.1 hypothetical protein [Methylorubrum extorquens]MCP1580967.1 hypothetical protein [Methylorubrum extorquens]
MAEPLSVLIQNERDAARTFGLAAGLLIGGASQADAGIRALGSGIDLIAQASRDGGDPAAVAAQVARLEREAAYLLDRLVAMRAPATASTREAA